MCIYVRSEAFDSLLSGLQLLEIFFSMRKLATEMFVYVNEIMTLMSIYDNHNWTFKFIVPSIIASKRLQKL